MKDKAGWILDGAAQLLRQQLAPGKLPASAHERVSRTK